VIWRIKTEYCSFKTWTVEIWKIRRISARGIHNCMLHQKMHAVGDSDRVRLGMEGRIQK
jgi:hypothetical protein